ncbi:Alpha/beta hydrolase of unknown function [Pseudonocardia thermophila]|uniref:Alpha/beta hydrolase family protein n=2 Tax=Pseudonocardia thermophila TaxID=1848 RepID=A0A1M6UX49_PSETH|nr:Alpha/beta hydrolase of unknown function [Pseudonocardia thermophila]
MVGGAVQIGQWQRMDNGWMLDVSDVVVGGEARSIEGARAWLRHHLELGRYPMRSVDGPAAVRTIGALTGVDPQQWCATWLGAADEFVAQAGAASDVRTAAKAWWQAYRFASLARFPAPNHPAKARAYELERAYFLRAVSLEDPPARRVEVPFHGRADEGESVVFYVVRPIGVARPPVVIASVGVDAGKEAAYDIARRYVDRGVAVVLVDIPGVGEAPVLAGPDAERMWDPVLDWIAANGLDADRVAVLGSAFGGYWAHKLAHTHRDRLVAAVNWGGGVHVSFQPSWQQMSCEAQSYLTEPVAVRARMFGVTTFDEYAPRCAALSLLDQGLLDTPSCPLLLVSGKDGLQSVADVTLSLEHGQPKTVRLFSGGHPAVEAAAAQDVICEWLIGHLTGSGNPPTRAWTERVTS